jgi:Fe-S cluster assembly protein SufB
MTHLGKKYINYYFKGISAGQSQNSYRGLVRISPNADNETLFAMRPLLN